MFKDRKLFFTNDELYYRQENGVKFHVMHGWETPIMQIHANTVSKPGSHVLEVGFGLGISAGLIQANNPASHTIVEIHPQVIERLKLWAEDKPNVTIIEGDWYDNIDTIISKQYDGIFFDTHDDEREFEFAELVVDKCIKPNGVFSYFFPAGKDVYKLGWKLNKNYIGKITKPSAKFQLLEAGIMDLELANQLPDTVSFDCHVPYATYGEDD
jgi:protein arginine N-methyltransferase 2